MEAIAERAIEKELCVKTSHSIWREHLYELSGFKALFGEEIIRRIMNPSVSNSSCTVDVPNIDFGLARSAPFEPLLNMQAADLGVGDKNMQLVYRSESTNFHIVFRLDFENERLVFDIDNGIYRSDDNGTFVYAKERQISIAS